MLRFSARPQRNRTALRELVPELEALFSNFEPLGELAVMAVVDGSIEL